MSTAKQGQWTVQLVDVHRFFGHCGGSADGSQGNASATSARVVEFREGLCALDVAYLAASIYPSSTPCEVSGPLLDDSGAAPASQLANHCDVETLFCGRVTARLRRLSSENQSRARLELYDLAEERGENVGLDWSEAQDASTCDGWAVAAWLTTGLD